MRQSDVKLGMKVVPHRKFGYKPFFSVEWRKSEEKGQPFLYVIGEREGDTLWALSHDKHSPTGDHYQVSDFEPYSIVPYQKGIFDDLP